MTREFGPRLHCFLKYDPSIVGYFKKQHRNIPWYGIMGCGIHQPAGIGSEEVPDTAHDDLFGFLQEISRRVKQEYVCRGEGNSQDHCPLRALIRPVSHRIPARVLLPLALPYYPFPLSYPQRLQR
jgi:hypothetical protein